ncbi:MAG TPA: hypothetical protein VHW24_17750 [Bryobacteraceae bacterium]|nr:hypothetical protein [Bryobacteraceae bacterium]
MPPREAKQEAQSIAAQSRGRQDESQFRSLSELHEIACISRGNSGWRPKVWMGIAAALLATGGIWYALSQRNTPERLLAAAYTASRPFEARLADSGYAPLRVQRGAGDSLRNSKLPLREAEEQIQAMPETPAGMELRGRAELLENRYEQAIDWLTRAVSARPRDADALSDLACAYLLRGEAHQQTADYVHATDLLLEGAKLRPNDSRLLYNLALALERGGRRAEAIDAWKHFLQQEKNAEWAAEGRERLNALERQ